jgi:hypothetical protein
MSTASNAPAPHEPELLCELAAAKAPIAGDVVEISEDTWAIHGTIPVDGDVILAEFDSYGEARTALDLLQADRTTPAQSQINPCAAATPVQDHVTAAATGTDSSNGI